MSRKCLLDWFEMFCRKCGKELPDDSKFCPYCGMSVNLENEEINYTPSYKKITFKEAVVALFNRFFVFKGTTGQREFNYGLLFMILISMGLSMIISMPEVSEMTNEILANGMYDDAWLEDYINSMVSKDIWHYTNLYSIASAILYSIFFVAPVYRRMIDTGKSEKFAMISAILFVVSEIACCNILYCLLPDNIYNSILGVIDILSIINLANLLMCVFGKSKKVY